MSTIYLSIYIYIYLHNQLFLFINRNPNGLSNTIIDDWPLYTYPQRKHIILDVFNKSIGIAHRAEFCAFWEYHIPILLEEFGKKIYFSKKN